MLPIIGQKYGQWIIISEQIKKGSDRHIYWHVKCKCGKETFRSATTLVNNRTKSCKSCSKTESLNTFALSYFRRIQNRAKKFNLEFNLTPEYLWDLYEHQKRKCALSNLSINFTNSWATKCDQGCSLDRIDNNKGYIQKNVQWLHKDVNFMKHIFNQDYFIQICKKIANNN